MVSAHENPRIDDVERPQPIPVRAVPSCFQDSKSFRASKFDCIICDFFEKCKNVKV